MIVRIADINEAAAIVELYRGYNRLPAEAMSTEDLKSRFTEINQRGFVAVAVLDGLIVGTYSMYYCANLAHAGRPFAVIENVIVAAHVRSSGVGRSLMAHAKENARLKDCYKVMLSTGVKRPQNLKFYEACGFVGDKIGFQIRYDTQ